MATSQIRTKMITRATFTLSLAPGGVGLANGSSRQSDLITNSNNYPGALVYIKIKSGASVPTANTTYEVFLVRKDSTISDDNAGTGDAAITIENSNLLGVIIVTASAAKNFYGVFDTSHLGALGPTWGIAIRNNTGQAVDTTESNHVKGYSYYVPELQ
jgi:hypothetical protein